MYKFLIPPLLGLIIGVVAGPLWIPFFRRLKFGQYIREDGPQSHLAKQGTPTFGGAIFLTAFVLGFIGLAFNDNSSYSILFMTLAFALIGFIDDYIIVVRKDNEGLRPRYKMIAQFSVALIAYFLFFRSHISHFYFDIFQFSSWLWAIIFIFITIATTNATNLTDGIDGLCGSITLIVALFFSALSYHRGIDSLMQLNLLFAGALLAYLIYNWHPAKIFMGDMGSLAIGGYVVANAVVLNIEWFIPLFGFVYLSETISVILQVYFFKTKGKRIFKMAPIHHHFQESGWTELQLVYRFSSLTAVLSLLTYLLVR